MPASLKRAANSLPINCIITGSIWWFKKASTFRTSVQQF
jgi:hypothetical protein